MLFTLRSSLRFSASMVASLFCSWVVVGPALPGAIVPLDLSAPPEAPAVPAELVPGVELVALPTPLVDPELDAGPEEFAVPNAFVPGEVGTFAELPTPLGSLPELFRPAAFAGPLGTPLTPAVPAPADPALGDPAALPVPAEGPLAAPPPSRSAAG
jgi:hypothetical protein